MAKNDYPLSDAAIEGFAQTLSELHWLAVAFEKRRSGEDPALFQVQDMDHVGVEECEQSELVDRLTTLTGDHDLAMEVVIGRIHKRMYEISDAYAKATFPNYEEANAEFAERFAKWDVEHSS